MKYLKLSLLVLLLIVSFALSGVASASPAWSYQTWSVVKSPNRESSDNVLNGVAAISSSNVWAVGQYIHGTQVRAYQTLVEHWNGTSWKVVDSPNVGTDNNILDGVAAISTSDIWAVGYYINSSGVENTLAEHWNGISWNVVPSPNVGSAFNNLFGVSAVSGKDVWAVGSYYDSDKGSYQTLIEHWNGTSWMVINSPNPGSADNHLSGVSAASSKNAWAVGSYSNTPNGPFQTLIERWNGTSWSVVNSPNVGSFSNHLSGVSAVSTKNAWAVGAYSNSPDGPIQTLTERWNGTSWSMVSSPNVGSADNHLNAVSAISPKNAWAVGSYYDDIRNITQTLIEYWNGTSWSVVSSPNVGSFSNSLSGVVVLSPKNVWAVGAYFSGFYGPSQTLTEHCC